MTCRSSQRCDKKSDFLPVGFGRKMLAHPVMIPGSHGQFGSNSGRLDRAIASGLPTIRELSRLAFEARRQVRSVLWLARGRTFLAHRVLPVAGHRDGSGVLVVVCGIDAGLSVSDRFRLA